MKNIPRRGQIFGIILLALLLIGGIYRYYSIRILPAKAMEIEITEPLSASELPEPPRSPLEEEEPLLIAVHVVGAVEHPGVYTLEEGQRIDDAVKMAVPTAEADLSLINLAASIQDGRQIYVPQKGEEATKIKARESAAESQAQGQTGGQSMPSGKVNINKAGVSELDTLKGIGPALAQRIIDYRQENGPFSSIEEITEVSGIGPKLLENIRNDITI